MRNKTTFKSLSRRADFLILREKGQSVHVSSWLLANYKKTQGPEPELRCGWTIPRQIGSAVLRNRFRRWGREFLRKWSADHTCSVDVNLIFKRRDKDFYKSILHEDFDEAMEKLVARLGRLGGYK